MAVLFGLRAVIFQRIQESLHLAVVVLPEVVKLGYLEEASFEY